MSWKPNMRDQMAMAGNPLVQCACGRIVNADMMRDIRSVKERLGSKNDYCCDSCMERSHRTGALTREEYYRAAGAPKELVDKVVAREARIKDEQLALRQEKLTKEK